MGIVDTFMLRPSGHPYMTEAELSLFNRLRANNSLSVFRAKSCEVCSKEIHQSKQYCSRKCYQTTQGKA